MHRCSVCERRFHRLVCNIPARRLSVYIPIDHNRRPRCALDSLKSNAPAPHSRCHRCYAPGHCRPSLPMGARWALPWPTWGHVQLQTASSQRPSPAAVTTSSSPSSALPLLACLSSPPLLLPPLLRPVRISGWSWEYLYAQAAVTITRRSSSGLSAHLVSFTKAL